MLDPAEARILGCLIEKDITTPEYYPMTINALVNACNQKSNRDPVFTWDEEFVSESVDTLRAKHLVGVLTGGGNRVPKYSHRLQEVLNLGRREVAVLCELLVRGAQTLGELRDRASRMHRFSDTEEVETCLHRLAEYSGGPLVMLLPRQAGHKEARYAHLLCGEPQVQEPAVHYAPAATSAFAPAQPQPNPLEPRVAALESEVRELRAMVEQLKAELGG